MAKTTNHQNKNYISTNKVFKKAGKEAVRSAKANRITKVNKRAIVKHRPEPELSAAFSASLEDTREHIYESAVTKYDTAYRDLSQRLMEMNLHYANKEQDIANLVREFTAPFKNEEIEWMSTDGKQSGTILLSNRMKKLKKTIDVEEQELRRQWEDWLEVDAEIVRLAAELVGTPNELSGVDPNRHDTLSMDQREMTEEIEAEKVRFGKLMEQAAKAAMRSMKETEKELKLRDKKIQDKFLKLLREQEYWE